METRIEEIQELSRCLEMRESLAKKIVEYLSQDQDFEPHEMDEVFIEYNYYVVMVEEISREIGISVEKTRKTILASKVWLKERKRIQKRNPDAWII